MTPLWSVADVYPWIVLPLLIFSARVCDVSLGTIRIIFLSKGVKYLAPVIGFCEIMIWLLAIGQIMQNLTNFYYYVFYAGGFATGTYVGMYIEGKLSIGMTIIRVITRRDASALVEYLNSLRYGVTTVDAQGEKGKVQIIFTIIKRRDINSVVRAIKQFNPNAFYSIEDVRSVSEGAFLPDQQGYWKRYSGLFKFIRKGK